MYWPDGGRWHGLIINLCTLIGSVIGQFLFGFLADYYGRTRLYGIELVLVIVSTIGVATSSYGYQDMSFLALFSWVSYFQLRVFERRKYKKRARHILTLA